jgi:uncharacterized protein YdhG (YjbR/CyaY superfamily)
MAKSLFTTTEEYIAAISDEQKLPFEKILTAINQTIDPTFTACIQYNMISYVVPLSIYQDGYHCAPGTPLPFVSVAANKGAIAIYHMGIYCKKDLMEWFVSEYAKRCNYKLDMGKSCIRFKKYDDIPYDLISELMAKMSANDWINTYETAFRSNAKK